MAGQKSVYILENRERYRGVNPDLVVARSSWERAVMKFFDTSPTVKYWSSESVVVKYFYVNDGRDHRYFIDFAVELQNGKKLLIEVKPASQTRPPVLPASGRVTKSFKEANEAYVKNLCKWKAAHEFAERNGCEFAIWTENTIKKLGIKI